MTTPFESLKDHFLIAMPSLTQGVFAHSLTYLCEHNEHGAMGIIINRPMGVALGEILEHLNIEDVRNHGKDPVMAGGPVQTDRGFVLHRTVERQWESTLSISAEISLTTSRDILDALAHNEGPDSALVALGYAGWGAGQLESELVANSWLTIPADSAILFNTPIEKRLDAAAAKLGIDLALLAPGAGHA
ncbi:MAG TPA: YqgE/AlgH family protein [Spongiibacteraceae bacterium]